MKTDKKYLHIYLTKHVQDLYEENFRALKKEAKEDLCKWSDIPSLWIKRPNIVKMLVFLDVIYRLNPILVKIPAIYFVDIDKWILKII